MLVFQPDIDVGTFNNKYALSSKIPPFNQDIKFKSLSLSSPAGRRNLLKFNTTHFP